MTTDEQNESPKDTAPSGKPPSKPKRISKPKKEVVDPNAPPKITRKVKKEIELATNNVDGIVRHIRNVQDNCILLGKKLIQQGHIDLGVNLIRNGFLHDSSKFVGIEWENMAPVGMSAQESAAKLKLKMAIHHHNSTNLHHPEAWTMGIKGMPLLYLAEFVCDVKARSEEFGTSLRDWIDDSATKRWGFTKTDEVYKKIMDYIGLVCEAPFSQIK